MDRGACGLLSVGSHIVRHNRCDLAAAAAVRIKAWEGRNGVIQVVSYFGDSGLSERGSFMGDESSILYLAVWLVQLALCLLVYSKEGCLLK